MSVPVTARGSSEEPNTPGSEASAEFPSENYLSKAEPEEGSGSAFQFLTGGGVLFELAKVVMTSVGADGIAIAYDINGVVICRASCGSNAPPVGTRVNLNSGIAALCLREGTTVICGDTETDQRVNQDVCRSLGVRSMVAVPLRHGAEIVGLAQAFYAQANGFSSAAIAELESSSELFVSCLPDSGRRGSGSLESSESPGKAPGPELSGIGSSSAAAWAAEIDRLLEQRGFKPASVAPTNASQASGTSKTLFAQLQQPPSWKKPAMLAIAVAGVCLLLWVGLRGATGSFFSGTAANSDNIQQPEGPKPQSSVAELLARAQTGNREAQIALAQRYQAGEGVSRNLRKAYAWYIVAGEGGSDAARQQSRSLTSKFTDSQIAAIRFEVGEMYAKGTGVPRPDNLSAYKWFVLAEAAGDKRASAELKKLAASMRQSEVQEARSRASAWLNGRRIPSR